jgi:hypothetical protein
VCGLEVGQAVLRASRGYARPQEGGALLWRAALPRTARQRSLHRCFAGPWETVGFGIMGAYGLNKLDEFEKSSRAKFDEAFKMKLDRNRVRARRRCSAPRRRCMQPRVAPPRDR